MGEREQGGMLRTVVVVGLVAMISMIIILGVIGLGDNMKSTTNSTSSGIQKEIKNANSDTVESVVDDYDTSNHYYSLDGANKTAAISSTKPGKDKDKGAIVIPSYVTYSGVKYTVTKIDSSSYYNSPELTGVVIPDTIKSIGSNAFSTNPKLTKVTFGKGVETIGNSAFWGTALSSVMVPDNVKTIGDQAFDNIANNRDGLVSIGKDTTYSTGGWRSSFGVQWIDYVETPYKPTIRN